jgi:septal ring factor EnvC (AmiA/AmiB activator)
MDWPWNTVASRLDIKQVPVLSAVQFSSNRGGSKNSSFKSLPPFSRCIRTVSAWTQLWQISCVCLRFSAICTRSYSVSYCTSGNDDAAAELAEAAVELDDVVAELDEAAAELDELVAELDEVVAELDEVVPELDEAAAELDELVVELEEAGVAALDEAGVAELNEDGVAELDEAAAEVGTTAAVNAISLS